MGAGGAGAGPRLAVGLAILALAFLAGISGMRETLAFFKHLLLQDAIWMGAGWVGEAGKGHSAGDPAQSLCLSLGGTHFPLVSTP